MAKVHTSEKIKAAAFELFSTRGYADTSIAAIESAAGLAPRAGAFYRHFESKQSLLKELALERITETPGEFDFDGLRDMSDTRAELVAIARQFEIASERQRPLLRLIEEVRHSDLGRTIESEANTAMLRALAEWVAGKTDRGDDDPDKLAALTLSIFGGWLFYLTKKQQGLFAEEVSRDEMLGTWATFWAGALDSD